MNRLLSGALLGSSLLLGGCALAPGSDMPYEAGSPPIDELVDVQPITFSLVQAQSMARDEAGYRRRLEETSHNLQPEGDRHYHYQVGRGDVLNIVVYDHPELTIPAGGERSAVDSGNVVHSDGTIFYPYVGRMQVAGKTVDQVRRALSGALADYIAAPQVEVSVASFESQRAYVSGAVANTGAQPITNTPLTVLDAIAGAGGLTDNANWRNVVLTRDGEERIVNVYDMLQNGRMDQNQWLRDGDVLHVPTIGDQRVYVLGEVLSPQDLPMGGDRLNLMDALSQAGGIDEFSADASGIFVIRQGGPGDMQATVYQLNADNAAAFVLGTQFRLEPQDIVYVTTAPISRWNRVISQLLPSTNLARNSAGSFTDYRDL